jgi:hypothetical protein
VLNQEDLQQEQQTPLVDTLLIEQVTQFSAPLKMPLTEDKKTGEDANAFI